MGNLKDYTTLDLCHLIRDRELERLTAEQKDTLTKELDASSEKNKGEMIGLRDGMAELLDERVRVCQTKFFSSVFSGAIALKQIYQVAEVKEQLQRQLGQVEAQLAAQKKVSRIS